MLPVKDISPLGGSLDHQLGRPGLPGLVPRKLEQLLPDLVGDLIDGQLLDQLKGSQILENGDPRIGDIVVGPLLGVKRDLGNGLQQQLTISFVVEIYAVQHSDSSRELDYG